MLAEIGRLKKMAAAIWLQLNNIFSRVLVIVLLDMVANGGKTLKVLV